MESNSEQLAGIVRQCLDEGRAVEIDGLGVFRPGPRGGYEFRARTEPRVFLAYVQEDVAMVERLYEELRRQGFDPWLDRRKLLPGQNWPRAIERAIEVCDFFIACLSRRALRKKSQFQSELRFALDCANGMPFDEIYFIPVRLEDCAVPARIRREIQYVDLFPDWARGLRRIVSAMEKQRGARMRELPLSG